MKKLAILFICSIALFSCLRKESDLLGGNVTIKGRLTRSCEDSTPVKYQIINISDNYNFKISASTDSLGCYSVTVPANSNFAYISSNQKTLYLGVFCLNSKDIGTIFLNPCVKAIIHYDTVGHKQDYSKPFGVMFDTIIPKNNLSSLSKPDSVKISKDVIFKNDFFHAIYVFSNHENTMFSKELLVPSYKWNHYTVKVP